MVFLAFAVVVLAPLGSAVFQLLGHPVSLTSILAETRQWRLLGNTLALATLAAAGATLLGFPAGVLLASARGRWHAVLSCALVAPLLLPPYILAVVWIDLLGAGGLLARIFDTVPPGSGSVALPPFSVYNLGGAAAVLSLTWFPLAAFATANAWRRVDGPALEAARVYASPMRTLGGIQLPAAAPGMLAAAAVIHLLGLLSFTVPSLLQVPVYPVEIYTQFSSFYDGPTATAQAIPLVALGLALLWAASRLLRPYRALPDSGRACSIPVHRRWLIGYLAFLLLVAAVLPVAHLVWRALPLHNLLTVWRTAADELATSLLLSAATATLGATLALAAGLSSRGRPGALFGASALAFLLTGPVLGVCLIHLWNHAPVLSLVYDSVFILVLACLARYLVFAHFGILSALSALPARREEAAAASGASLLRSFLEIQLPQLAPALILVWGLLFILSLGELDAVVLVAPPGYTPLSVRVYSLMHYGPSELVAALCLLAVVVIFVIAAICALAWAVLQRRFHAFR